MSERIRTRVRSGIAALCVALIMPWAGNAQETEDALPSVEEVNAHLDKLYRSASAESKMTMTIKREERERELSVQGFSQGEERGLFVITSPAREAGTATLRTSEGLWNYAPRADRLMRVPSGMLSEDWMGSHLTNDDLVRETSYEDDFEVELAWGERDGERVLTATMVPREGAPVTYSKIEYALDAREWTPIEAVYFDGEEAVRTITFSDVKEVDGRPIPHRVEVRPADAPGEFTRMVYEELQFDVPIDDAIFTQQGMRRQARQYRDKS
ncbi:outer membrane lipoprotein-sorting protein [Lujinxingia sediminis]|uniref:Outer membrane lipoprotein-sorting protein n=1 Tax=Lujinxingia sediminis TaxID=2480984 RepID=A0ABY0CT80_9DELT|nr:outer membrane lipoprotein-sorting protein [Lujinxingia sediminis]RVU43561.1 outer membrane lipoprotein-sorting protein [Lujinxingia sediminis]